MTSSFDRTIDDPAKILLVGESGVGKTGAKAALVAMGYKLRMIDTDNGFKILRALLTDSRYPYAAYMKHHGIDPAKNVSVQKIDVPIDIKLIDVYDPSIKRTKKEGVIAPTSSKAWNQIIQCLGEWKDGDENFGGIGDWGNDTILDFDTLSTLSTLAYYFVQDLNNRLGVLDDEHGRDNGGAQELVRRLLMKIAAANVKCNVIVTTHINRVDMTGGIPQSPEARLRANKPVDPKGYPAAIGRALGPQIGKWFNDSFVVIREGRRQEISSVPTDNVSAKNSVWLEPAYGIKTGLAEIFCALRYQDPPLDLIKAAQATEPSGISPNPAAPVAGFGARRA